MRKFLKVFPVVLIAAMLVAFLSCCHAEQPKTADPMKTTEASTSGAAGSPADATDPTVVTDATHATVEPTSNTKPNFEPTTVPTVPETTPAATDPTTCSHSWSGWVTKRAATCLADGYDERTCSKCGETDQRTAAATGHKWDGGTVTKPAGECLETGIKTYTCQTCAHTRKEQINGRHTFGSWEWEEYEYTVDYGKDHPGYVPGFPTTATYTSHRKVHTCSKCGYQEDSGTPDHSCKKGSSNHAVTTVKKGVCGEKDLMRSTCTICGWYVEYDGKPGEHPNLVETVEHLTDYTETTNELDAVTITCTACDTEDFYFRHGEGWTDSNKYEIRVSCSGGDSYSLEHPEYQTVRRDFVYDDNGYVKQFTLYWWYDGSRCSQVINCDYESMKKWFLECGYDDEEDLTNKVTYHLKIYGIRVSPYRITWTG